MRQFDHGAVQPPFRSGFGRPGIPEGDLQKRLSLLVGIRDQFEGRREVGAVCGIHCPVGEVAGQGQGRFGFADGFFQPREVQLGFLEALLIAEFEREAEVDVGAVRAGGPAASGQRRAKRLFGDLMAPEAVIADAVFDELPVVLFPGCRRRNRHRGLSGGKRGLSV